jgi:AcrR family transcriptional regulator
MKSEPAKNPQSSPRIRKKRKRARTEILQAALAILRNEGVEAVTLASVAGALDMTKQAIYHYFPSKDALMKALVTSLLEDEVEALVQAVTRGESSQSTLSTLIRAFYSHYINNLEAFRTVYCLSQLSSPNHIGMDETTIREQINPRTHKLFDVLEARLSNESNESMSSQKRQQMRQLAFVAWTSALGLMTMLSVADAVGDPLIHKDEALLSTLETVFDQTRPASESN